MGHPTSSRCWAWLTLQLLGSLSVPAGDDVGHPTSRVEPAKHRVKNLDTLYRNLTVFRLAEHHVKFLNMTYGMLAPGRNTGLCVYSLDLVSPGRTIPGHTKGPGQFARGLYRCRLFHFLG
jgi:hypothetical protein